MSHRAALTPRYRMGLRTGESVPLRTLLEGVAIASANDAATAVAEHLGGTEDAFVAAMNAKAEELGLAHTRFANAHGLPDPSQRSTAEDLARLTQRLLEDYPSSRPLLGGATFVYRGRVYSRRIPLFQDPGGVQALKTGFTREAGYNLAISAWRVRAALRADRARLADAEPLVPRREDRAPLRLPSRRASRSRRPRRPRRSSASRRCPRGVRASAGRARRCPPRADGAAARVRLRRLRHALRRPLHRGRRRGPSPPTRRPSRSSGARSSSSTRGSARSWSATRTSGS